MKHRFPIPQFVTPDPHFAMRRRLLAAGAAATATLFGVSAGAQIPFPAKSLQIVVSAAPGGSPDILARILAPKLAERLGKAVTVDNRVGGAGNIAAAHVAKSSPDGHTLFVAHDGLAINQTLFDNLPFHATQSFAPVIQAFNSPQVLAVHSDVPAKTLAEFVSLARAHPEKYALASPAIGTTGQLGVLLLQNAANIKVKPVVYRSAQPALTDVLGKHADGIFVTLAPALPHIKEGRLRALAVSTAKRDRALPDVPTFAELGIKELTFASWQGIVAPANTPRPVVERLNKELNAILADSEVRAAFAKQAFEPVGGTPEEFARLISESIDKWAAVIRANNIRADA